MVKTKNAFWQALILTLVLFSLGLIFGYFFESYRADAVRNELASAEINLLDQQIGSGSLVNFNLSCDARKSNLISFADKIYSEALALDNKFYSAKLTGTFILLHKRYDLLRLDLWAQSIKFKQDCGNRFDTVVYVYNLDSDDLNQRATQNIVSHLLYDTKQKYGDDLLLIPIAGNMNLYSVNIVKESFGITGTAVVINEKNVLTENFTLEEIDKYLNSG